MFVALCEGGTGKLSIVRRMLFFVIRQLSKTKREESFFVVLWFPRSDRCFLLRSGGREKLCIVIIGCLYWLFVAFLQLPDSLVVLADVASVFIVCLCKLWLRETYS